MNTGRQSGYFSLTILAVATMGELYAALSPRLPAAQASAWRAYFQKWGTPEARKWARA